MGDSTEETNGDFIAFTQSVSKTLRDYFRSKREQRALGVKRQAEIDEVTARYDELTRPHIEKEAELRQSLIDQIWPMKHLLISGKRKSASTPYGTIEFKAKAENWSLINGDGFLKLARKDRRVTELFERVTTLKPRTSVYKKLLKSDSKFRERYSMFFEKSGGVDELRVRPSDRFFSKFDKKRLTDESDNLGTEPDDVEDKSPDA